MGNSSATQAGGYSSSPGGKRKFSFYCMHIAVAIAIVVLFWVVLPAPDPITPVGMRVSGAFLGMIYLWVTVEVLWPSIFGLILVAFSGVGGDAGFLGVITSAFGSNMFLMMLFVMALIGGINACGATVYIAKFILTRKIVSGRPMAFLAILYICCWVMASLMGPGMIVLLLFPVAVSMMEVMGVTRDDRLWKFVFVGMFALGMLGQPMLPFYDAQYIPVGTYESIIESMGLSAQYGYNYLAHMIVNIVMSALYLVLYLLALKFMGIDMSKLKAVNVDMVEKTMPLPPMSLQQKLMLLTLPAFVLGCVVPAFVPANPVSTALTSMGPAGIALALVLLSLVAHVDGKPLMNFRQAASEGLQWHALFMVAVAVYTATALSKPITGVSAWVVQALTPVLGGRSEMVFVAMILTFTLIITSFANNAAMGLVMTPIAIQFAVQMGINPLPVEMCVVMISFAAMLTPAASPPSGLLWGSSNVVSPKDILTIGFPYTVVVLLGYIFLAYPLAKGLCALLGAA